MTKDVFTHRKTHKASQFAFGAQERKTRKWLAALMLSTALGGIMVAPQSSLAQPAGAQHNYSIRSQPLSSALFEFAAASGIDIFFDQGVIGPRRAEGLSGSYTVDEGMRHLLAGSGLSWRFNNGRNVTVFDPARQDATSAQAVAPADGSTLLDTITITGNSRIDPSDAPYVTPGSSSYISSDDIERRRGTSPGDFLKGTPGVLNSDNRNSGALDVNIRGMQGEGRTPVIVDGALQETTIYRGYSGIAGRTYIDPDLIGGVIIEKGPSMAADANGAIGGVVRMNTLNVDDILLPGRTFGVRLKGGFNTNSSSPPAFGTKGGIYGDTGWYRNDRVPTSFGGTDGLDRPAFLEPTGGSGSIAGAYTSEHLDLVAAYARRKNGNYYAGTRGDAVPEVLIQPEYDSTGELTGRTRIDFDGRTRYRAGEEVLNTSQDNTSYLLKGTLKFDGGHKLEIGYNRYHSDYGEMMPSMIIRGRGAYQGYLNEIDVDSLTARYNWNPDDNDLIDLNINAFGNRVVSRINSSTAIGSLPPELNRYYSQSDRWGVSIDNTSFVPTDAYGDFTFRYGAGYNHQNIGFPDDETFGDADSTFRDGWRSETNAFGNVNWKPTDWLMLDAGLRYSSYKAHDRNPIVTTDFEFDEDWNVTWVRTLTYGDPIVRTGDGWSPIASVTVEPWGGIQFYGKYASAMRAPSLFEATKGWSQNPLTLAPERSNLWEGGMNVLRDNVFLEGDKFRLKASYFDNRVKDYLTRTVKVGTGASEDDAYLTNIDFAAFRGTELSASYDARRFFGQLAWSHYLHTEFCMTAEQSAGVRLNDRCYEGGIPNSYVINQVPPKDSVSLTLGARAFEERLEFGGTLTYVGKRPTQSLGGNESGNTGGSLVHVAWKPQTTLDLFASYKVNDHFKVDAAIDNVTDTYYLDPLALGLIPAPGRTFRLNMTTKF